MKKLLRYTIIEILFSMLIFVGMMFYSQNFEYDGIMDALFVAGFIMFTIGWLMFVIDFGVFDVTMYGLKQFGLAIAGKRPKKTLEEALYNKERLDKIVYQSFWIAGAVVMIAALIMYAIYYAR